MPRGRSCRIVSIGNDSMVFTVVERPFFAEVVAAFKHFAVGVVTVVFVAGYQSVGRGDLVEKQKPHAYRMHSISGLKVFSGLRFANQS